MRTLDDIIPPSRRKDTDPTSGTPVRPYPERRPRFPFTTVFIVLCIAAASIGALFYFSSAKVEITPKTASAAVQSTFTATQSTGDLPFEIITADKVATQSVSGSGTRAVNTAASGSIAIYNTQAKTQKLIANTRFATTAGLIFRIHSAVTVPAGTPTKPGSVTATVYADQNGSTYNIPPSAFTLPGLAGTPQASQVYARSTGSMTGGASGTVPVVNAATENAAKNALVTALGPDLEASIKNQIPAGYILLPGAATTTYRELAPAASATTGMVDIKEQGTITAVVFPNTALAKAIAGAVPALNYRGESLTLATTTNLTFSTPNFPEPSTSSFSFTLTGTAPLVYSVDVSRIAAAIAGKTRSAAEVELSNYPEVDRAIILLRPFWRQTFPEDPASISVTVLPR